MWRGILKTVLYIYLVIGIGGCVIIMLTGFGSGSDGGAVVGLVSGLVGIFFVLLLGSGLGLILELADNVSRMADNVEEIRRTMNHIPPTARRTAQTTPPPSNRSE